jgi:SAM-dependent methyltransferase
MLLYSWKPRRRLGSEDPERALVAIFFGVHMDERKAFFESSASTWDRLDGRNRADEMAPEIVRDFAIQPGDAVLDVGTGTGVLLPLLGKAAGTQGTVVAIDFAFGMLVAAASRGFDVRPSFFNAAVSAIPFKHDSFDKVTCFSAFPHFPDKAKALAEMARVLKTDGTLFIAHIHSIEEIAALHDHVGGSVRRDHLPGREAMAHLMGDAGFSDIEIHNEPGRFLARGRKA